MKKFLILALGFLFALPCALRAEEVEILLTEVIHVGFIPRDDPLDGNDHMPPTPPCPACFRATINGHALAITKQEKRIQELETQIK